MLNIQETGENDWLIAIVRLQYYIAIVECCGIVAGDQRIYSHM